MSDFKYFKADRVYNELYYQFPKVFLVSEKYKGMSDSAKIAYMLLKARLEFAIKKKQIDENGNVYFTFTIKEICDLLNCQKQKAVSIKKELEKNGLLLQVQMGFNKQERKNNKNRLYLSELVVEETDIYYLEQMDSANHSDENAGISDGMKITPSSLNKTGSQTAGMNEGMKIIPSKNVDMNEGMKISTELYNNTQDTNRHIKDTKEAEKDAILLSNFVDLMKDDSIATFVPESVLNLIRTYSNTFEEAQRTVKIIHNAKFKAQQELNITIVFEELDFYGVDTHGLYTTLLKAYQKQRNEKVQNIDNVIFIYVKNWFVEKAGQAVLQSASRDQTPSINIPMHDWSQTNVYK